MVPKILSVTLVFLLFTGGTVNFAAARSTEEKSARRAAKVKEGIIKLGVGKAARVKVKLNNKTKLEGYISASDETGFTVTSEENGVATPVEFPQVKSVKGNNLSTGAKIAIGVGIAAAVIFAIYFYVVVYDD
jgi:hypothetical protein